MRTRRPAPVLPALVLLALLAACGSGGSAAPASPSPSPSPAPAAAVFDQAEVRTALLAPEDVPGGYRVLSQEEGGAPPEREQVRVCQGPRDSTPPRVPVSPAVLLQGPAGYDSVEQAVAVLPDEATAVAVLAAVQRHAKTCRPTATQVFRIGDRVQTQETVRAAVVPLTSGAWKGVRQSSRSSFSSSSRRAGAQRWSTQHVVLRRGNAVLDLDVSGETTPPDLAVVLGKALAKLDATL